MPKSPQTLGLKRSSLSPLASRLHTRKRTSQEAIRGWFNGGALDSQVTDSQHIRDITGDHERLSDSEDTDKGENKFKSIFDYVSLKEEFGPFSQKGLLYLDDELTTPTQTIRDTSPLHTDTDIPAAPSVNPTVPSVDPTIPGVNPTAPTVTSPLSLSPMEFWMVEKMRESDPRGSVVFQFVLRVREAELGLKSRVRVLEERNRQLLRQLSNVVL